MVAHEATMYNNVRTNIICEGWSNDRYHPSVGRVIEREEATMNTIIQQDAAGIQSLKEELVDRYMQMQKQLRNL